MSAAIGFWIFVGVIVLFGVIVWSVVRVLRGPKRTEYTRWEDFK